MPLRRDLPSLNALAAVEAAVRNGNFSQAARELDVAASAISRHIAQVEDWSGLQLFERRGRHVVVTPQGAAIAESVRAGFDDIARTIERLQREKSGRYLTVACTVDVGMNWLMPRYADIRAAMADVEVRIVTSTSYANFDSPDIDLSIRFGDGKWPNMESELLIHECAYPVASPAFVARYPECREITGAADLVKFPLLELDIPDDPGLNWRRFLRHYGLHPDSKQMLRFPSHVMMLHSASRGDGIPLFWKGMHDRLVADGEFVRLGDVHVETKLGYYVVGRDLAHEPVASLVRELRAHGARA
ncbi:MAG: LysR family transcriptional regulator [bacterium]|nr:LysR family transcriptional regulator [bacterium]